MPILVAGASDFKQNCSRFLCEGRLAKQFDEQAVLTLGERGVRKIDIQC
jgi:hypothetical protein